MKTEREKRLERALRFYVPCGRCNGEGTEPGLDEDCQECGGVGQGHDRGITASEALADDGEGIRAGEWIERDDGMWALRIERAAAVPEAWINDPDSMPSEIIDACRQAIMREFGNNGTDGYYKRILAKIFRALAQYGGGQVPEGWKLVPMEPDDAMVAAAFDVHPCMPGQTRVTDSVRAAIAAAPEPDEADAQEDT